MLTAATAKEVPRAEGRKDSDVKHERSAGLSYVEHRSSGGQMFAKPNVQRQSHAEGD
jgi:hypothetical protein